MARTVIESNKTRNATAGKNLDADGGMGSVYHLALKKDQIEIDFTAVSMGSDLAVLIAGGTRRHVGAVTLSVPRRSLAVPDKISATTSVLALTGHKDDETAKYVSEMLASRLNKTVVTICGIHLDGITGGQIETVWQIVTELTEKFISSGID